MNDPCMASGSISFGSLLVAFFTALRAIVQSLTTDERGNTNCLGCICGCILGCIENMIR